MLLHFSITVCNRSDRTSSFWMRFLIVIECIQKNENVITSAQIYHSITATCLCGVESPISIKQNFCLFITNKNLLCQTLNDCL